MPWLDCADLVNSEPELDILASLARIGRFMKVQARARVSTMLAPRCRRAIGR